MGKIIIVASGVLAIAAWFAGELLYLHNSPLADFVRMVCFPLFTVLFLVTLFGVCTRSNPSARNLFRGLRVLVLLGMAGLCIAIVWPRSYGTPAPMKRPGMRYWNLPTGSHIAYSMIPAKGAAKPAPVIYLQGGPGGTIDNGLIRLMTPIAEESYDVYLYDQIGSGWSDRLTNIRDYTALRHVKDLEAIVQMIGAEKVILIGQSWGAILATLYAADHPDRVAQLILTGPGPIQPGRPGLAGIKPPDSLHLRQPYYTNHQGNDLANNIRTRAMSFFATNFGWKLASDEEADDFAAYLNKLVNRSTVCDTSLIRRPSSPSGGSGSAGFYVQIMTVQSFSRLPDPRPKLKNSPIPVLVMKGECDNQSWGTTREYLELFPLHQLVVIPGAGHGIFIEQRERYLSTIKEFLAR